MYHGNGTTKTILSTDMAYFWGENFLDTTDQFKRENLQKNKMTTVVMSPGFALKCIIADENKLPKDCHNTFICMCM